MLTVMYDDDMPGSEELESLADTLAGGGTLHPSDADRVARVLREVATGLRRLQVVERVSDEGFDEPRPPATVDHDRYEVETVRSAAA